MADESAENKDDGEELQGRMEERNLTTSQEGFTTEQNPEHEEEKEKTQEKQDIVPSEKMEPPDE